MTKKRVYEIAKELDLDNKKVLDTLQQMGVEVKNHMSVVDDAERVVAQLRGKKAAPAANAAAPAAGRETGATRIVERPAGATRPAEKPLRPTDSTRPAEKPVGAARRPAAAAPAAAAARPAAELRAGVRPPSAARLFNQAEVRRPAAQTPAAQRPAAQVQAPPRRAAERPASEKAPAVRNNVEIRAERSPEPAAPGAVSPAAAAPVAAAAPAVTAPPAANETAAAPAAPARPGVRPPEQRPAAGPGPIRPAGTAGPGPIRPATDRGPRPFGDRPDRGPRPVGSGGPGAAGGPGMQGRPPFGGPRPVGPGAPGRPAFGGPRPGGPGRPPAGGPRPGGPGGPRGGRPGGRLNIPPPPPQVVQQQQQQQQGAGRGPGRPDRRREQDERWKEGDQRLLDKRRRQAAPRRPVTQPPKNVKPIILEGPLTVKELGIKMAINASEIIKRLLMLGVMATINQEIDVDTAQIVATEMGYPVEVRVEPTEAELDMIHDVDDPADLQPRAPVVTIMGHVDHGKTSLLDAIRETRVAAGEAGGITQHIGAYQVELNEREITFLDTPGHEAFTAMRARGAQVTDVAVLVVAADDGVMPQTVEAINHAKAAGVPIIVAINKIDKPGATPDRVKQELTEHGLVAEEWGGETIMVPVSAKERIGLDQLLEMILLVADMKELKANPNKLARGTVIEAQLDKGRGPVATVLVQAGTLKLGDAIVAGTAYGRVRAMIDDTGKRVKKAGPSMPVEVLGFATVPAAGDIFRVFADEKEARELAEKRANIRRATEMQTNSRLTLEDLQRRIAEGQLKDLNVIVKADVQGSVEALRASLEKVRNEEVKVNVIHAGVGAITESDVMLATASGAIIIGFHVRPDPNARTAAEREQVDVRLYRIIYDAIDDIKAAIQGMLKPKTQEVVLGRAEVRQLFKVPKIGTVAGCYVTDGKITRNAQVRLLRDNVVVFEGSLASLRRFKDDVREVVAGFECGIGLENFNDLKEGDQIEAFTIEEVKPV